MRSIWPKTKKQKCAVVSIIVAILLLIIVVPIAVIFSRKQEAFISGISATVLFPLYIYPTAGAWDPLYQSIESRTNLTFMVIINPDSGPGTAETIPNDDYLPNIRKLNNYTNVQTIGYVRTGYQSRNITNVLTDVQTYSYWAQNDSSLAVSGIFFDEIISTYSQANMEYLQTINAAAKNASGLAGHTIVHNPGSIQEGGLENNMTDIVVIFEGPYSNYQKQLSSLQAKGSDRHRNCFMVHSIPSNLSLRSFEIMMNRASLSSAYLFFTSLSQNYYETFGGWDKFINAINFEGS